jgi:tetratricopeptide (TPR) repeat protein
MHLASVAARSLTLRSCAILWGTTLFALVVTASTAAQRPDLDAFQKEFDKLYAAGEHYAALVEAQKLEAAIKSEFGNDRVGALPALRTLAIAYVKLGNYADAEGLFKRALAIDEKALGPTHPDVANRLTDLALLRRLQDHYAEAELLYKRALVILENTLGPDHLHVAITLDGFAVVYRLQGRYEDAELLSKRALEIRAQQKPRPLRIPLNEDR